MAAQALSRYLISAVMVTAASQCENFTMPNVWPAWAPKPPYSVVSAKFGGTIDCVFMNNLTLGGNSSTTMGGKLGTVCGGSFGSPAYAACANSSASIVGYSYKYALTYPYGTYSGLYSVGPFVRASAAAGGQPSADALSAMLHVTCLTLCSSPPPPSRLCL